jgi:hypothetical protein
VEASRITRDTTLAARSRNALAGFLLLVDDLANEVETRPLRTRSTTRWAAPACASTTPTNRAGSWIRAPTTSTGLRCLALHRSRR